jgi:hypothetical protein
MQKEPESSPATYFCNTTMRIPIFWPEIYGLWFAQTEDLFNLATIFDHRAKFNYVNSHLEYLHVAEIEEIIISPLADEPYTTLMTELLRRLLPSHI